MSIKVKVAGAWKDSTPKVKVAGAWKTIVQASVKVAGVWKDCISAAGPTVITTNILSNHTDNVGICYSEVRINSDGDYYRSNYARAYASSTGPWLTAGTVSQVWVQRTINTGSLTYDDIGTGRVACTTSRDLGVVRVSFGVTSCTFTLYFYDAASGGNLLASKTVTVSATNDSGGMGMGCPLCCFTPDTLISVP